jgi:hypothetical protein
VTIAPKKISNPAEKAEEKSAERATKKPPLKSAAKKRSTRKKKPKQPTYDHLPIIIFLLVIFSFTLFAIGIGLTRYLSPERAGMPACSELPCSSPLASVEPQKGGGE